MFSRRQTIVGLMAVLCCSMTACDRGSTSGVDSSKHVLRSPTSAETTKSPALAKAVEWLWSKQAADGGWHSNKYRLLASGQALTPFVLNALQGIDDPSDERAANVSRALQFIRAGIGDNGAVGLADSEVLEYPTYATAYALRCLIAAGQPDDRELIRRMKQYLVDQQYRAANGFGPQTVVFGGWGFGGPLPSGGSPGHMDIHHTRCVLEALRDAGEVDRAVIDRAEQFLGLMQRYPRRLQSRPSERGEASFDVWNGPFDGGFYFSPIVLAANKAGLSSGPRSYYRSYASPTCDGILALLACNVADDDERILKANKWLDGHPELDWPGGVPRDTTENWGESIRFTHFSVRALTMRALDSSLSDRHTLRRKLISYQQADGSFQNNDGFLMKEDDPLLCTTLAVVALVASP